VISSLDVVKMIVAPVAGLLLGFLDFVWIKFVPFPFGGLGNSIAVWAVAAFLLTFFLRWPPVRAVAAAVVMLVVAVPSYYVAAALIQHDDWSRVADVTALIWAAFGILAGVVFGLGGVLARHPGRLRLPALALPSAVLLAELLLRRGDIAYVLVLAALAVLITAVIARTGRDRVLALAWSLPLAGAGYLLMVTTAFHPG
jgi:Family of unknown function (DUF6518)